MLARQTVNFAKLENTFSSKAKPEPVYRRMHSLFAKGFMGETGTVRFIFPRFCWHSVRFTPDRSTWEHGKFCINLLVLTVV